jgi:AraC-like DNA-binding protein/quercetin dioxygenase-like cupin family protein
MPRSHASPRAQHPQTTPFTDTLPAEVVFRAAQMPADAFFPHHRHHWGEFVYAFSGVMEVQLATEHYLIPPQYGLWLPPEVDHTGMNRQEASFCSVYVMPGRAARMPQQVCALTVSPLLHGLLEHLRQTPPAQALGAPHDRLLQVVLDQLEAAPVTGSYLPTSQDPLLAPVLQALEAAPGDSRSVADWAALAHTTERTLMRRCQSQLGMTLAEWRQRLRTVKAMALLEAGEKVEHIAQDLGYASTSAFIGMFRRLTGTTPDAYRKGR